MPILSIALVMLGVLHFGANARSESVTTPTITYMLTQELQPEPVWNVHIVGEGFSRTPRLRLGTWGGWSQWEGFYIRNLITRPAARDVSLPGGVLEFAESPEWKGAFDVCYHIPILRVGSTVQQHAGLLPSFSGTSSSGFAVNTLMDVLLDTTRSNADQPERIIRIVRIVPPVGASVATGWGGVTKGAQEVRLTGPIENTPIVIGVPASLRRDQREGITFEVAQFGTGWDRTEAVLRVAENVVPLYDRDSGFKRGHPVRIFLFDGAAVNTGTRTAIIMGYRPSEKEFSSWSKQTVAHELFHDLLGYWIEANDSIAWFHEGFTDYLSLWYAAASGVVDRDWFAARLTALDDAARRSAQFGKVAFAQGGVNWRASGYEALAYRGGAALAFLTDVELRKHGRRGLIELIADLGKQQSRAPVTMDEIAGWLREHGLAAFYESYYEGKGLPEIEDALKAVGYGVEEKEAELTYFGIRVETGGVAELDPEGPEALAGMRVGDKITCYFTTREDRPVDVDRIAP